MKVINKDVTIKAIEDLQDCYNGFSDTYDKACIIGVIDEIPAFTEEDIVFNYCTKHAINEIKIKDKKFKLVENGTWKPAYFDFANRRSIYICSVCGAYYPRSNYCPTCGSKMTIVGQEKINDYYHN